MVENTSLKIEEIMALIPHRYPFLLVDRIENVVPAVSAVGHKCVSMNEPFFQRTFPWETFNARGFDY